MRIAFWKHRTKPQAEPFDGEWDEIEGLLDGIARFMTTRLKPQRGNKR